MIDVKELLRELREEPYEKISIRAPHSGKVEFVAKELAVYGMEIIDFGPGVLSMHSPFEISSKADLLATVQAYNAFYRS